MSVQFVYLSACQQGVLCVTEAGLRLELELQQD
jgi:hypothetical protein